ncbi:MAG: hypothetical protein GX811_08965 [Lentisphaerae bacterium]|nr:hypothetical protein [Lentisphaerota bacterium]
MLYTHSYAQNTCTWTGNGTDELASTPENWSDNTAPVAGDAIVLDSSTDKNMTWDLNIPVQSWTQDGYEGVATILTVYSPTEFYVFRINGDCIVNSGTLTHQGSISEEVFRLAMAIGEDLTIGPDGHINADAKGFAPGNGPGGLKTASGGSYGGKGAKGGPCYGSVIEPVNLGSGANMAPGGGAVSLEVTGSSVINGKITANGGDGASSGSGGSILLKSESLAGTGSINADGGRSNQNYPGGGGRVSVVLSGTNATVSGFSGNISTYGGIFANIRGKTGTIYLEDGNDDYGRGELIVDNPDSSPPAYAEGNTALNGITSGIYNFKRITFKNNGILDVSTGGILILTGTEIVTSEPTSGIWIAGGTVITPLNYRIDECFIGISKKNSTFNPAQTFTIGENAKFIIDQPHSMSCRIIVEKTGTITHTPNPHSNDEFYKLSLDLDGTITIDKDGSIDVSNCGFPTTFGPGSHPTDELGGSYGGKAPVGMPCYGSVVNPDNLGSGGRGPISTPGGGAILLNVSGTINNFGSIVANSLGVHRPGSGGTVNITAGNITGPGSIEASATTLPGGYTPAGGGGRVAITLTDKDADIFSYEGKIAAHGAKIRESIGGAGTVYLRNPGESLHEGTLIIDNNGHTGDVTEINSQMQDTHVGKVIIRNKGHLKIEDASLTVSGSWSNHGDFTGADTGSVIFSAPEDSMIQIKGNTVFYSMIARNHGATLEFEAGSITTINSHLELTGSATKNLVLKSGVSDSPWYLTVVPEATCKIEHVNVTDSDASEGVELKAENSTGADQNNKNWEF